jgi:hypothetical protein
VSRAVVMRKYRHFGVVLFSCVAFIFMGCEQNSTREVEQTRETLTSWSNSLILLEEQWHEGRVPPTYLKQMLKRADKALTKIQSSTSLSGDVRKSATVVEAHIHRLQNDLTTPGQQRR